MRHLTPSTARLRRALLAALCSGWLATPAAAAPPLHVIPFPGTPDASPSSDVIFSSLRPSQIASVSVGGSVSGAHRGRLVALPAGAGTAFIPDRRFSAGDHVTVTAVLRSPAAGTASGDPRATRLGFSFGVAAPARVSGALLNASMASAGGPPTRSYVTAPHLHPPVINVSYDHDHSSGDIFLTPNHTPQVGPLIVNGKGEVLWFSPQNLSAFNLELQHYHGRPVLTWWQGAVVGIGYGAHGQNVIMNRSYKQIAVLHGGNGFSSDLHEFQLTKRGTALIDAYVPEKANLSSVGGPSNGTVLDCVIQELDVKTGAVLWEWHAMGHIPLNASERTPASFGSRPFDYFHLNSIQQLPDGNLLISARNTWSLYKINRTTGKVMWTLGGKNNTWHLGPGTNFSWQHDAHLQGNVLTVFDDAWDGVANQQEESESSAKSLRVDINARKATLIRRYTHSPPVITGAEGSAELLSSGNMFVGWGSQPTFSEYGTQGKQVMSGTLPLGTNTYRAFRFRWGGMPVSSPSLALVPVPNGSLRVYASWNGATRVVSWRVLGGPSGGTLGVFGSAGWGGFETRDTLHSNPGVVQVQALGSGGKVLGSSAVMSDPAHLNVFSPEVFARASSGTGEVPVGCYTSQSCRLSVRISSGGSVLAHSQTQNVAAGAGALIAFKLSAAGRSALAHASNHRLPVQVTVNDQSSSRSASTPLSLVPYSIAGSGPSRSSTSSPTIELARTTGFVSSSTAIGQILAGCQATTRACEPKLKITAGGQVIATATGHLGARELGELYFTLTKAGQTMLFHAHGNQLAAQITLTDAGNTATGHIALVHYR